MPSSLESIITKPVSEVFRRLSVKRRIQATGLYETSWQDMTDFVKSWGSISLAIDDVRLNKFTHSGLNLVCRNDGGKFNPEANPVSFWYGYLSRYRTMVKVEAGYYDESGTELPTLSSQGIYLMDGEVEISGKTNEAILNCKSLVSVFDEVRAVEVAGLGATQTASQIITKIRDHTDGAGNFVFQQFITTSAWSIQSTTGYYNLATSTSLDGITVWELMGKLAESEGYVVFVNRSGNLVFRDREPNTTTVALTLYGQGFANQNIISLENYKEALDKYYNFFRFKWQEADTSTSYVFAGSTTTVDPSSTAWKYGTRIYEFENTFFLTNTTAQNVVNNLYTEFSQLREELTLVCKMLPQVEISDRVSMNYRSYDMQGTTLWDQFNWDEENWALETGENFDWNNVEFKVLSKRTDLMKFTTTLRLRRV